jgi:hypothetical protein
MKAAKLPPGVTEDTPILKFLPWYWLWAHNAVTYTLFALALPFVLVTVAIEYISYRRSRKFSDFLMTLIMNLRIWILYRVYEKYGTFAILAELQPPKKR